MLQLHYFEHAASIRFYRYSYLIYRHLHNRTSHLPHTALVCRSSAAAARACMALTSAVANAAAAAAAAGAGKKAAQVALQAELNNDDDWNKFLTRDGLLGEYCAVIIGYKLK